ncbi:MAG: ORF6N domain-containing protein [Lachnospiraceae bacterium]|nr:ORF6N domain-containing protein [Lachnospiraceae bacterium]
MEGQSNNDIMKSSDGNANVASALMPIENLIYVIRGQQVMLDSDLARLYGVETKYLKRAVKSNISRFPADFMMELSLEELDNLRCKNCTSSSGNGHGGIR